MPLAKTLPFAVLGLVFCQCASGPAVERKVTIQRGARVLVNYRGTSANLTLINRSSLTREQADAARRKDPGLKVVTDAEIQRLLDLLGGARFFDMAAQVEDPEARSWLTVLVDGKRLVASGRAKDAERAQRYQMLKDFKTCIDSFNHVYSVNDDFTSGDEGFKRTIDEVKASAGEKKEKPGKP